MFTERDLAGTYEESGAVYVTLSDDGITGETDGVAINGQTMTITAEGTYIFSGTLSEGQIVVDADNAKVQIVFDNVDITCASSAAVYVKSAEKVFVTLAEGSQNTLRNTDEYVAIDDNNIDAVIFAKSDLTLNGTVSLTIISAEGHGIVDAMSFDEMDQFIADHEDIVCPVCGKHDFTPIRKFNLLEKLI